MSTREDDWRAVHDPATSGEALAAIAGRHPEFGDAIAQHPHCYPELRDWIAAASAAVRPAVPAADRPRVPAPRKRRVVWIVGAAAAVLLLLGGGGLAWALVAANAPSADGAPAGAPEESAPETAVPVAERVLDGPPVYVGDELAAFLLDDAEALVLSPDAAELTRGSTVFTYGESEGAVTSPEACIPWILRNEYPVVGTRSLVWQLPGLGEYAAGSQYARQFPDGEIARAEYSEYADHLSECAAFGLGQHGGDIYADMTLMITAQSENGFVVEQRSAYRATTWASAGVTTRTRAVLLEGNVIVTVDAEHADGADADGQALLDALQARADVARADLTEKIGYR